MKFIGKVVLGTIVVIVVLVILLAMCTAAVVGPSASETQAHSNSPAASQAVAATATAVPTEAPTLEPAAPPVVLSGPGSMKTAEFRLSGDYVATWTSANPDGVFGSFLQSNEVAGLYEPIGVFQVSGTTHIYGLADAKYFLDVNSTSAWTVTLTPVQ